MIKNYFKIAWRNLRKNKAHSFIKRPGYGADIIFHKNGGDYLGSVAKKLRGSQA
jgi:hypothetical protein